MSQAAPVVFVVDDDDSVRESLALLIESAGWGHETFSSAEEFLSRPPAQVPSCLVLDVTLPHINGLELQERIATTRSAMPIIFISGHGDVPMTVRAMKGGAVEFLTKPLDTNALLNTIGDALERSRSALGRNESLHALQERYASLSPREKEVMKLVVSGRLNKQIGGDLGISEITVKAHRGRMTEKMQAKSVPDLVNMASALSVLQTDENTV